MNPILVEVHRNNVLENFHRGVVCVVDQKGEIIFSVGDVMQVCYPRSAMKFFQVLPLIENGGMEKFGFTLEEIAVMCGSHNAEPDHLRVVRSILMKIGKSEKDLACGPQYPTAREEADELIRKSEPPRHIHNNCSGKHAGMLALCVLMGFETDGYLNPTHSAQQMILDACVEVYGYTKDNMTTALDGCSAPIYAVPVYNQALGFKNLVDPVLLAYKAQHACRIVIDAVSKYPFMVAGSKRYCTDMMEVCAPRIIGKTGAEGIFSLAIREKKIGVCIKIDDGKMGPQYNVAQALIEASGIFTPEELSSLRHYKDSSITNFNKFVTGNTTVNNELFKDLHI